VDVTVGTSGGSSPLNESDLFTYGPARVSNVQPNAGPEAGGSTVAITGSNFRLAREVKFGQTLATEFKVNSETSITAVSPPGTGAVDVTVANANGSSVTGAQDKFTYSSGGIPVGWGANGYGQLGIGTITAESSTPVEAHVPPGTVTDAVAGGEDFSLAVTKKGEVLAWGGNEYGDLGNGTTTASPTPEPVEGLGEEAVAIAAGRHFGLALLKGGTVKAWGENSNGQLGNGREGSTAGSTVPVEVHGLKEVVAIAAGEHFAMALLKNGQVWAWGDNTRGELGAGSEGKGRDEPGKVQGLSAVGAIAAGAEHALALLQGGTVMAWGSGVWGQLGNGREVTSDLPVEAIGLSGVTAIAGGALHSLALLGNGKVEAFGNNEVGQLGSGNNSATSDVPVEVTGLSEATAVAGSLFGSIALLRNGAVEDWGDNEYGQLGIGTSAGPETCLVGKPCSRTPVAVKGLTATGIAGAFQHGLAIR
jgi:alpha-tubulin suppressor-like RCC1 family protein